MNLKYMVSCMLLVAISTLSIVGSEKNGAVCDFENVEKNDQKIDPIFGLINQCIPTNPSIWDWMSQNNNITQLDNYLKNNPQAINERTPYETELINGSHGTLTRITDGMLPFHILFFHFKKNLTSKNLTDSNNPVILCLQVLLNHTGEYNTNNHIAYQKTIEKKHNLNEDNSHHDSTSFLELALRLPRQYNNLFTRLTHISSQREKDIALEEAIDHAHGYHCSDTYLYEPKIEILRNNEANINHTSLRGRRTMLHRAFNDNRLPKAMNIIKKYGADMTCKDDYDQTPFDYYEQNQTQLYKNVTLYGTTVEQLDHEIRQEYEKQMSAKQI